MLIKKILRIKNPLALRYASGYSGVSRKLSTVSTTTDLITTAELSIEKSTHHQPAFQMLDRFGKLTGDLVDVGVDEELSVKMYHLMVRTQCLDDIFYNAQRQGRISFYMQHAGEEGTLVGSASALDPKDMVFAQYREVCVLLWRGFTLQQAADQCFSNEMDLGQGRQMPVHYGSRELNFQTISSPLATQMPQAVGAAYSMKLSKQETVAVCYFGEGAASEGDAHAAFNFASTLKVPMLFICRNNGYAISTPSTDQYNGDGIYARAAGYGMHAIRVDGNDTLAVRAATIEARNYAMENSCPVLIEAMTYRAGHHSTSDDSTRYRSITEIRHWQENNDPVHRFRQFMEDRQWWNADKEQLLRDSERMQVLHAMEVAEKRPKPHIRHLFEDVFHEKEPHLLKQEQELKAHMEKYPEFYSTYGH